MLPTKIWEMSIAYFLVEGQENYKSQNSFSYFLLLELFGLHSDGGIDEDEFPLTTLEFNFHGDEFVSSVREKPNLLFFSGKWRFSDSCLWI